MSEERYMDGSYLSSNPSWDMEHSEWKAHLIHKALSRHQINPTTVAEVGCGAGRIISELSRLTPTANFTGFDISADAINLAKQVADDSVSFQQTDFLLEEGRWDLVICADVFEHVDDFLGFLRKLSDRGSAIVFHIPLDLCVGSVIFPSVLERTRTKVGHIHYFTRETALASLKSSGYEILEAEITAGCIKFPAVGVLGFMARLLRSILFRVNPQIAARLLGGFSLLVVTATS